MGARERAAVKVRALSIFRLRSSHHPSRVTRNSMGDIQKQRNDQESCDNDCPGYNRYDMHNICTRDKSYDVYNGCTRDICSRRSEAGGLALAA